MVNVIGILIIALMILTAIVLYRFLFIRGLRKTVAIFRDCGAIDAKHAKSLSELGLQTQPYVRRMFRPRDYKISAAELLFRQGVIQATGDGKAYLSEEALSYSPLKKYLGEG